MTDTPTLPPCIARHLAGGKILCRHPKVRAAGNIVPAALCLDCAHINEPAELRSIESLGPAPLPPLIQRAKNFAKAAVGFAADGFAISGDDVTRRRLSICQRCDQRVGDHCSHASCGCHLAAKAPIRSQTCPLGKWAWPRVGFLLPMLPLGGVERLIVDQLRYTPRIHFTGVAVKSARLLWQANAAQVLAHCPIISPDRIPGATAAPNWPAAAAAVIDSSDVLIAWGFDPSDLGAATLAKLAGKRVVLPSHCTCSFTRQMLAKLLPIATDLVAVSRAAAESFPADVRERVVVITNGVDVARVTPVAHAPPRPELGTKAGSLRSAWGIQPGEQVIGYLGRLALDKNPLASVEAARALNTPVADPPGSPAESTRYKAVLVGDGIAAQKIRQQAPDAIFPGASEAVGDVLAAFDCLVCCARDEGFGLSIVEGLAAGVPVVATAAGIVPEAEEQFGPLVWRVPFDASGQQLAEACKLALSPAGRELAARARQVVLEHFTIQQSAERFSRFLHSIAQEVT
jgi:glycosyltransferase involved in cell wall biosynthesis